MKAASQTNYGIEQWATLDSMRPHARMGICVGCDPCSEAQLTPPHLDCTSLSRPIPDDDSNLGDQSHPSMRITSLS